MDEVPLHWFDMKHMVGIADDFMQGITRFKLFWVMRITTRMLFTITRNDNFV